ncbi:MAG: phenylalanine--tRNA ligase subunit beta, partial [Clostridia bacterium]|nr:phenylalanine--tRNA ligase subunit beta [Clostridia bacterium]
KDTTSVVVFESANFMGSSVRITSRALGMRTESSGRFEKGLDSEMTRVAIERACELAEMLGAGEVVDGIIDARVSEKTEATVKFEPDRINHFLGTNIPEDRMISILRGLLFRVEGGIIYVPSWRDDVRCMNDIAEEIIRIWGYNEIKSTSFRSGVKTGEYTPRKAYSLRLNNLLCSLGCWETCNFSFISPKYYDKIRMSDDDPRRNSVVIRNPLGEDTSVMRTVILPSVLESLSRNNNSHAEDTALYETASVYLPGEDKSLQPSERLQTAIAFYGGDFYTMKGIIETILDDAGVLNYSTKTKSDDPTYHPGRCAEIRLSDKSRAAVFGELHPLTAQNYGFDRPVYAAVIDTEKLASIACFDRTYKQIPRYPAISRDFAFLCNADTEAGTVEEVICRAGGKLVEKIDLFDVFRGEKLGAGKKSLAFNVSLRSADHTLTDDEADKTVDKILRAVEKELGFKLREM